MVEQETSMFRTIFDNMEDGVYFVDRERRISMWNQAAVNITGYKKEDIMGCFCHDNLLNHVDKNGTQLCLVGCPLFKTMEDGISRQDEVMLRHKSGHRLPVQVRTYPIYQNGLIVGALELFSRKTASQYDDRLVQALTDRVMRDTLTGLPNQAFFQDYVEYKLAEFKRRGLPFTLLMADVDNLMAFNRTYSRTVGDVVLQSIGESFRNNFFDGEKVGVWRPGMFIGVFDYVESKAVYAVVEKLRILASRSTVLYNNQYLALTVSVGMTLSQPNDTLERLIGRAEKLMTASKKRSKNCCTLDIPPSKEQIQKNPEQCPQGN